MRLCRRVTTLTCVTWGARHEIYVPHHDCRDRRSVHQPCASHTATHRRPLRRLGRGGSGCDRPCRRRHRRLRPDPGFRDEPRIGPVPVDLVAYSPDRLVPRNGFILDTERLNEKELRQGGVQAGDSLVSDHLMLVTYFAFEPRWNGDHR